MKLATATRPPETDILSEALALIEEGRAVVDVYRGGKNPIGEKWEERRYTADDARQVWGVAEPPSLGVLLGEPSAGLLDGDLDALEARRAAHLLMPASRRWHGRESSPFSHVWYVAEGAKTVKFLDPTQPKGAKVMLLELRSTGCQTVVPPSYHPSGECYQYHERGEPAAVEFADLRRAAARLAAVALIARHWPEGARHEAALALGGWLARHGIAEDDVALLVEAVATAADDRECGDRVRAARDSVAKVARGEKATGGKRLAELLGEKVIETATRWLGLVQARPVETVDDATEPLDVFGDLFPSTPEPLSRKHLPPVVADFAEDTAERLGVDLGAVALPCLVTVAGAISDAHRIQPRQFDTSWSESARLWIANVAESGEKKSPAITAAIAPLREVESGWALPDHRARVAYENEKRAHDAMVSAAARRRAKGLPVEALGEPPERPPTRRRIVTDLTVEALTQIQVDNPAGLVVYADELTGWFGGHDAYHAKGGKDRAYWLTAYDGGSLAIDRIGRGSTRVENVGVSILGGIQPGPMQRLCGKISDDGLVQRFIVYWPAPPSGPGVDRTPNAAALFAYHRLVAGLVNSTVPDKPYTLDCEARAELVAIERLAQTLRILPHAQASLKGHLGKWPGMFARLLLIHHLAESAGGGVVGGQTAKRVADFMGEVMLPHVARFHTVLVAAEHQSHARWVAGLILSQGPREKITARDIGRAYRALRKSGSAVAQVMDTLSLAGWVTAVDGERGLPTCWSINPRVFTKFAERARLERERRGEERARILAAAETLGLDGGDL